MLKELVATWYVLRYISWRNKKYYVVIFKRQFQAFERRNWRTETIIFNNPDVPLQYASSGLTIEPHGVMKIPLVITETMDDITLKITARFGSFSVTSDYKRILTFKGFRCFLLGPWLVEIQSLIWLDKSATKSASHWNLIWVLILRWYELYQ